MLKSSDALDAVLAAFGARAAANRTLKIEKPPNWKIEGAIAIKTLEAIGVDARDIEIRMTFTIRTLEPADHHEWDILWRGYLDFYES